MYINEKVKIRVIAMLMCILLLSNFGLSVTLAAGENGIFAVDSGSGLRIGELISYDAINLKLNSGYRKEIKIIPEESGVYEISVQSFINDPTERVDLFYELCENGKFVSLAAVKDVGGYRISKDSYYEDETTIEVILDAGKTYTLTVLSEVNSEDTVQVQVMEATMKSFPDDYAVTNVPATIISSRDNDFASKVLADNEEPNYKFIKYTDSEIRDYAKNRGNEEEPSKGGFLEGILVNIIMAFGSMLVSVVEYFLGTNVKLTIDNIIFNKYDQVVIDLTPLGGIQVDSGSIASGKGIFNNPEVGKIIKDMFDALKTLAIMLYILILLYIGLRILLSIGSKDQSKYLKYIEYWLTGILILEILPFFIPAIPAIGNAYIDLLYENALSLNGNYSVREVLIRLGKDESYLGEDAEVVVLRQMINEEIDRLTERITDAPMTREQAQAEIDGKVASIITRFGELDGSQKEVVNEKVMAVIHYIDDNFSNWDEENQAECDILIKELSEYLFSCYGNEEDIQEEIKVYLARVENSDVVNNDQDIIDAINRLVKEIKDFTNNSRYYTEKNKFGLVLEYKGINRVDVAYVISEVNSIRNRFANLARFNEFEQLFKEYKDAVIQEEIETLRDMRKNISNDVMTRLKTKAKEEHRLVYAIAWCILLFQMFSILFLYFKRVFVIVVLIVIFPLVMVFYIYDKVQTGKSQALDTWIKELTANILVQMLHASIYILLINIGIEACNEDPEKNWFFLILTVCFLFPGERMLRSIIGLSASTLGELKTNTAAVAAAAYHGSNLVKNGYRGAKDYIKQGGPKGTMDKLKKSYEESQKVKEDRKKRRSDLEESKKRIRTERMNDRMAEKAARDERFARGTASRMDRVRRFNYNAATTISGFRMVKGAKKMYNAGKATMAKIGSSKFVRGASKAVSVGNFALKKGGSVTKKALGLAAGVVEGAENFGQAGVASAFSVGRKTAKGIGGFKDKEKVISKKRQEQRAASNGSKNSTIYQNGQRVRGHGNQYTSSGGTRNNVQIRVTTNTITNNNPNGNSNNGSSNP